MLYASRAGHWAKWERFSILYHACKASLIDPSLLRTFCYESHPDRKTLPKCFTISFPVRSYMHSTCPKRSKNYIFPFFHYHVSTMPILGTLPLYIYPLFINISKNAFISTIFSSSQQNLFSFTKHSFIFISNV